MSSGKKTHDDPVTLMMATVTSTVFAIGFVAPVLIFRRVRALKSVLYVAMAVYMMWLLAGAYWLLHEILCHNGMEAAMAKVCVVLDMFLFPCCAFWLWGPSRHKRYTLSHNSDDDEDELLGGTGGAGGGAGEEESERARYDDDDAWTTAAGGDGFDATSSSSSSSSSSPFSSLLPYSSPSASLLTGSAADLIMPSPFMFSGHRRLDSRHTPGSNTHASSASASASAVGVGAGGAGGGEVQIKVHSPHMHSSPLTNAGYAASRGSGSPITSAVDRFVLYPSDGI